MPAPRNGNRPNAVPAVSLRRVVFGTLLSPITLPRGSGLSRAALLKSCSPQCPSLNWCRASHFRPSATAASVALADLAAEAALAASAAEAATAASAALATLSSPSSVVLSRGGLG